MSSNNLIEGNRSILEAPFIRILVPFALGFIVTNSISTPLVVSITLFLLFSTALLISWFRVGTYISIQLRGYILWFFTFSLGVLYMSAFLAIRGEPYTFLKPTPLKITVESYPEIKEYGVRVDAKFSFAGRGIGRATGTETDSEITILEERAIIYLKLRDSLVTPGSVIEITTTPERFEFQNNPHQFNYKEYMEREGIFYKISLLREEYVVIPPDSCSPKFILNRYLFLHWQKSIIERYVECGLSGDVLQIVSALTVGSKQNLTTEIKEIFSKSGTMHILAVSGLHVGVVSLILNLLLSLLGSSLIMRWIRGATAITILIIYALITGASPSVVRAVVMFSLFSIGYNMSRRNGSFNTVAISAFISLVYNPFYLYSVGFQLSYGAIVAILYFMPLFEHYNRSQYTIIVWIYRLLAMSISAQIGTLPIVLFHFHLFAPLSIPLSLVAIPAATVTIYLSSLMLLISLISISIASYVGLAIHLIITLLIRVVELLAPLSESPLTRFYPTTIDTIFFYIFICLLTRAIESGKLNYRLWIYRISSIYLATLILHIEPNRQIIFYNSQSSIVHLISDNSSVIFTDSRAKPEEIERLTSPLIERRRLQESQCTTIYSDLDTAFVIDKSSYYRDGVLILEPFIALIRSNNSLFGQAILRSRATEDRGVIFTDRSCCLNYLSTNSSWLFADSHKIATNNHEPFTRNLSSKIMLIEDSNNKEEFSKKVIEQPYMGYIVPEIEHNVNYNRDSSLNCNDSVTRRLIISYYSRRDLGALMLGLELYTNSNQLLELKNGESFVSLFSECLICTVN